MTIDAWQKVLVRYATSSNRSEALMAQMLLDLSTLDDQWVERIFDRYASEVLEATP